MYFDMDKPLKAKDFGRIEQAEGFWHKAWKRRSNLLFFLASGDLVMEVDGEEIVLSQGDTLIVETGSTYRPLQSNGCVYYYFYFDADKTEEYKSRFSINNSFCRGLTNFAYSFTYTDRTVISVDAVTRHTENSRIAKIMNRCAELDLWKRPNEKMLLDLYLNELMVQLSLMKEASEDIDKPFTRMLNYIQRNYRKNITLSNVAESVHLSPSYAAKLFKKNAGVRCCDYINSVRLAEACGMLINTNMKIAQIADEVGYKSQYYFARQFKKEYGMTAVQYRKKGINKA